MAIHLVEVPMVQILKVDYHPVRVHWNYFFISSKIFTRLFDEYSSFSCLAFEQQLENEILPHSQSLASRKIAMSSYKFSSHSSSTSSTTTKQNSTDGTSQFYLPTENKSPISPTKKFFSNKTNSKEG